MSLGSARDEAAGGDPSASADSGPVLFARYAFAPNRLGLCGPEDWRALLDLSLEATASPTDGAADRRRRRELERGLRELASGFEGAFPYLRLIADAHGIADPLDRRVVEAYWIGSSLSDGVDAGLMARSIASRFGSRLATGDRSTLAAKPADGARPTHAFHVLEIFPRLGTLRGDGVGDAIGLMQACRIRWARVETVRSTSLDVRSRPLEVRDGRLTLGTPRLETVGRWPARPGPVADILPGDVVSLHWDWACEVLSPRRLAALVTRTRSQLALANATL